MSRYLCSLILFLYAGSMCAQEIVKWVDENGKVHYGDKVPEQYREAAETVATDISVISPEDQVREANQEHVQRLKLEDAWEESAQAREERRQQRAEQKRQRAQERARPLTREECRDRYVKRNAYRTECFRRAEEYERNNK